MSAAFNKSGPPAHQPVAVDGPDFAGAVQKNGKIFFSIDKAKQ